jgi:branched-chain amino acid transport system substrate-binding protein
MRRVLLIGLLVVTLVTLLLSGACSRSTSSVTSAAPSSQPAPTSTQPPAATAAPAPAAQLPATSKSTVQAPPSSPAAPVQKTIKIGLVLWEGWFVGIDTLRGLELYVEMENAKGGMEINGEKYKVQLISYDSNNSQATEVAAINRLVFQDKVQYIISGGSFASAWLSVTEQNKVIVLSYQPDYLNILDPKFHYVFSSAFMNTQVAAFTGWFNKNYPDLTKNIVIPLQDNLFGHASQDKLTAVWKAFGVSPTFMFYSATQTDLSSAATKVINLKPTAVDPVSTDNLMIKALYQAGFKGQIFEDNGSSAQTLASMVPIEALEGYISCAWPMEFDPVPAEAKVAQEYKAAWIAKYGKWTNAEVGGVSYYACLKSALQQSGSLDTDKLADIMATGLKFEGPLGAGQMINRPDLGLDRTVDSIATTYVKQIKGGQPTMLAKVNIDEGINSVRQVYLVK